MVDEVKEPCIRHMLVIDAWFNNGFNKAQALRDNGYAENTALHMQHQVFNREDVREEINRRKAQLANRFKLDQDWIVGQLVNRAKAGETLAKFKQVADDGSLFWDFTNASQDELALVEDMGVDFVKGKDGVNVKKFTIKTPDSHAALMALGKHLGIFTDKLEVSGGSLIERLQAGRNRLASSRAVRSPEGSEDTSDPETRH